MGCSSSQPAQISPIKEKPPTHVDPPRNSFNSTPQPDVLDPQGIGPMSPKPVMQNKLNDGVVTDPANTSSTKSSNRKVSDGNIFLKTLQAVGSGHDLVADAKRDEESIKEGEGGSEPISPVTPHRTKVRVTSHCLSPGPELRKVNIHDN